MGNKAATLSVCGRDFKVLEFNINLAQKTDNQGRPASGVFLGDFYLILEGGSDVFFEWLCEPTRMESGILKVKYKKAASHYVEYSFVQAFVTTILENLYDVPPIGNSFNQVSTIEDSSEEFEVWTNVTSMKKEFKTDTGTHILANSVTKTRQFQQRTGIPYVLMVTLSCERITIRDVEHNNQWSGR
ncbi:hypothetical protein GCM10023187_02180 [Nibrella viscosa]|uniref:Uncharacterized protein n=1 Tax=Nibrella viscosa TaxID=1084524 RepID=A0ABP8JSE1_9BACT